MTGAFIEAVATVPEAVGGVIITTAGTGPAASFGTVSVPDSVWPAGVGTVTFSAAYGAPAGAS